MYGVLGCKLDGQYSILGDGEYADLKKIADNLSEILESEYGKERVIVKPVTLTKEKYEDIREDARLIKKELSVYF